MFQREWGTKFTFIVCTLMFICVAGNLSAADIGQERWVNTYNSTYSGNFGAFADVQFADSDNLWLTGFISGVRNSDGIVIRYDQTTGLPVDDPQEWIHFNDDHDYFFDMIRGNTGEVILAGRSRTDSPTIWKYNTEGNLENGWPKIHSDGSATGRYYGVGVDQSNNIYAAALFDTDWFINKFNQDGTQATGYPITYTPMPSENLTDVPNALAVDGDGNIIIVGYVRQSTDNANGHIRKYSSEGQLIWEYSYDHSGFNDNFYHVLVDADDNILISGQINNGNANTDPGADYDWYLAKFSKDGDGQGGGQQLWSQTWDDGTNRWGWAYGMVLTADSEFFVVGMQQDENGNRLSRIQLRSSVTGDFIAEQLITKPTTVNNSSDEDNIITRLALSGCSLAYAGYIWQDYVDYGRTGHVGMYDLYLTVTPSSEGDIAIEPTDPSAELMCGSTAAFQITPGANHDSIAIGGNCPTGVLEENGHGSYTYTTGTLNGSCEITVRPTTNYTLRYDAEENGSLLGESVQIVSTGMSGSEVTAIPNPGYVFSRWSDGVTNKTRIDGNVMSNVDVTALFSIDPAHIAVKELAVGSDFSVIIRKDGSLWSWGYNDDGQIGDGSAGNNGNVANPVQISESYDWYKIAAGSAHSLGLKNDGTLWTWGTNWNGQLGTGEIGSGTERYQPEQLGTDTDWAKVYAGGGSSYALKADGTLWAWGDNEAGQLSLGHTDNVLVPTQVVADQWLTIIPGYRYCLGIQVDNTLWAWGSNDEGQLGIGSSGTTQTSLARVGSDSDWTTAAANAYHSLAIKSDGTLWAWGSNYYGQLGDGTETGSNVPIQIGSRTDWIAASVAEHSSIGLVTGGQRLVWGFNRDGIFGVDTLIAAVEPYLVKEPTRWLQIIMGGSHAVGLTTQGGLATWGSNLRAQLGNGEQTPGQVLSPTQIGEADNWTFISAGADSSAAVKDDNSIYTWGRIIDESKMISVSPHRKGSGNDWVLASVEDHKFAIKNDGTLWAWGNNQYGELGLGFNDSYHTMTPTQVVELSTWKAIATGSYHSLGIQSDGTLWSWGDNRWGQLGDNSNSSSDSPIQVSGNSWDSVAAGERFSLAIRSDGTLWSWGDNSYDQLGLGGSIASQLTPAQVTDYSDWMAISVNSEGRHCLAIRVDDEKGPLLYSWGYNYQGQLGLGDSVSRSVPRLVSGLPPSTIAAGRFHSLTTTVDGKLYSWGANYNGTLGIGRDSSSSENSPVQVGTDTDWLAVTAGEEHSLALKSDGTLWGWGDNSNGQAGSGLPFSSVPYMLSQGIQFDRLSDVIRVLQIISGGTPNTIGDIIDVNKDNKLDLEDILHNLQSLSE